ncbi:MAG: hypothetical protein LUG85_06135 [Clostridiales bacterium]|nr:hypothetical protein [Clostridiales bacterium]
MKNKQIKTILAITLVVAALFSLTLITSADSEDASGAYAWNNGKIDSDLADLIADAQPDEMFEIIIWLNTDYYTAEVSTAADEIQEDGTVSVSLPGSSNLDAVQEQISKSREEQRAYHTANNEALAAQLPDTVEIDYISHYAPVITAQAAKDDIIAMSELDFVAGIFRGDYEAIDEEIVGTEETAENETTEDIGETETAEDISELNHEPNNSAFTTYTLFVDGDTENPVSFLNNEFYDLFAEYYLEKMFACYKAAYPEAPESVISEDVYSRIAESEGFVSIVIFYNYGSEPVPFDETTTLTSSYIAEYDGGNYRCVKINLENGSEIENYLNGDDEKLEYIMLFDPDCDLEAVNSAEFEETYTPSVADARAVLRYAAKLDGISETRSEAKKFLFLSDCDFDGSITVSDARTALRIAAKLEQPHTYYQSSEGSGAYWER